ncbi:MAG: cell division/cell wall cluster transcriptional repressor MraZ, partial [Pseudomonadota bacterium]
SLNKHARRLQRLMIGHASDMELDNSGRLLMPRELREFAGIEKHAMLVGQGKKFELWEESRWLERRDEWLADDDEALELSAELETLSL